MASFSELTGALEALVRRVRLLDTTGNITKGTVFAYAEALVAQARRGIAAPVAWTPFTEAGFSGDPITQAAMAGQHKTSIWVNSRYQVLRTTLADGLIYLSIKRHDQAAIRSWRDLQRIKNELVGPECSGFEVFPGERHKLDGANQFHLFVNPDPDVTMGSVQGRDVIEPSSNSGHGQEPFEPDDPYGPARKVTAS